MKFRQAKKIIEGRTNLVKRFRELRPPYTNEAGQTVNPSWHDMRLTAIARLIEKLSGILYTSRQQVDFNQDSNCLLAFRIIQKKLLNGYKIADCINQAAGVKEIALE